MFDVRDFYGRLDSYFADGDIKGAEEFLNSGLKRAVSDMDAGAALVIVNELMGFYRAAEKYESALEMADQGLELCKAMNLPASDTYATTALNAATAYRVAGKPLEALSLYSFAESIYSAIIPADHYNMASLRNNEALAYQSLKRYEEAEGCLLKALSIVTALKLEDEMAATYVNLAANSYMSSDCENAMKHLDNALKIYENGHEDDSHYAGALTLEGRIAELEGKMEKAGDCYQHALTITYGNYGRTPSATELYNAAIKCFTGTADEKAEELEKKWGEAFK